MAGPLGAQANAARPPALRGQTEIVKIISRRYSRFHFDPKTSRVPQGTKIVWKNPTNVDHTITAYGHGWSKDVTLHSGDQTSFTFRRGGTYKFYCMIHGMVSMGDCTGMCGKIVVR